MRRRGVGVGAVKSKQQEQKAYETLGKGLEETTFQHVTSLLATFKESLEDFARKHKKDINASPLFRNEFQKMCTTIGVDPLASNKGFWAQLLGVGDFYYELAVQIIEICLVTRSLNGGLMGVKDLTQRLRKRRKLDHISEDDVLTAVRKIHKLGAGFRMIEQKGQALVVSVPMELSSDHLSILTLAQQGGRCYVMMDDIKGTLKWDQERCRLALKLLLESGMAWIDRKGDVTAYWLPSLWLSSRSGDVTSSVKDTIT